MKAVLQQTSNRKSSIFSLKAVLKPGDWKKKRLELVLEALMRAPPLGLEVQVLLIQKLLLTAGLAEVSCVILWHLATSRRAPCHPLHTYEAEWRLSLRTDSSSVGRSKQPRWTQHHYRDLLRPLYATQHCGLRPQIGGKCCWGGILAALNVNLLIHEITGFRRCVWMCVRVSVYFFFLNNGFRVMQQLSPS